MQYCTTVHNGVLCDLNTTMEAREVCRLHSSDVWYKRGETDPHLGGISKKNRQGCILIFDHVNR